MEKLPSPEDSSPGGAGAMAGAAAVCDGNRARPPAWVVTSLNLHRNSFQVTVRVRAGNDVHPDTAERLALLVEAAPEMLEALRGLFSAVEEGVLVRDVSRDAEPGWPLKAMRLVMTLKAAQEAIARARPAAAQAAAEAPHATAPTVDELSGEIIP